MDERFGASRALKALQFCHEFFIPFHIPALNFDHGHLLHVTSKTRTPNDWWRGVYVLLKKLLKLFEPPIWFRNAMVSCRGSRVTHIPEATTTRSWESRRKRISVWLDCEKRSSMSVSLYTPATVRNTHVITQTANFLQRSCYFNQTLDFSVKQQNWETGP